MKYFSMFSGIGGFEVGIQNIFSSEKYEYETKNPTNMGQRGLESKQTTGLGCIGFSEVDKYAIQIYKKHFPEHKEYGDVSRIDWNTVENFDLLVGGFPCQAFSIAGKRKGFSDTRGTLFFEIARCLREKQPRLLLLENVKGLLSHAKGHTFFTILSTLDELGYDLQWQVLNSKDFGVPQNRERVFIVGHLRGTSRPEVFPIGEGGTTSSAEQREGAFRKHEDNEVSTSITSRQFKGGGQLVDTIAVRRLTPTECERLQGFPDGWTEGISDTQRYKCLGNAVTTNVITAIMDRLGE